MKLMNPFFNQGYHLYVDNFYTSVTLFKDLFADGVGATGTIVERRRFSGKSQEWQTYPFQGLVCRWCRGNRDYCRKEKRLSGRSQEWQTMG